MCYTQLFNLLCEKADDVYGGRLPVHVRCLIDECANIGQIPKLEKLVATIRSREISACLVLQARSQLKAIYKDNADTIIGNMDSQVFLGGSEPTTLKELSERSARKPSTPSTPQTRAAAVQAAARTIRSSARMCHTCWWRVQLPWIWHEQGHDQLDSEKNRIQEVAYGTLTEENLSKRHWLYAGRWLLYPRLTAAGGKLPHWNLGSYAQSYLEQCHPVQYNDLLLTGKLWTYLADLNEQAQNRLNCIIARWKKRGDYGGIESRDQLAWVGAMNSIRNRAKEIVRHELIYDAKEGLWDGVRWLILW